MSEGVCQSFRAVIASGTTTSAEVDLGHAFTKVYVDIAGAVSTDVSFQAAAPLVAGADTYKFLKFPIASGLTAPTTALVGSASSGYYVEVSVLAGQRYVKVVARSAVVDGATIKIIAGNP